MKDFDALFKKFQIALQDRLAAKDPSVKVSYHQDPSVNGIFTRIVSDSRVEDWLIYPEGGGVNYVRCYR